MLQLSASSFGFWNCLETVSYSAAAVALVDGDDDVDAEAESDDDIQMEEHDNVVLY